MANRHIAIICWLVIVACTLTVVITTIAAKRQKGPVTRDNFQQVLQARYAVGLKALFGPMLAPRDQLMSSFDDSAKTSQAQVRAAIMAGELLDSEEALSRLARVKPSPEVNAAIEYYKSDAPSPEQTGAIRDAHGWFGDLAASRHDPVLRQQVEAQGRRTAVGMIAVVLYALGVFANGCVLAVIAIVLLVKKRLRSAMPISAVSTTVYLEAFTLYLVIMVGGSVVLRALHAPAGASIVAMAMAFFSALFWPKFRGQTWSEWRTALGLTTGRGVFREMLAGLGGYVATAPLLAIAFMITLGLTRIMKTDASHPIVDQFQHADNAVTLLLLLAAVVYAPVTEEILFRGAFYGHLRQRFRPFISAAIVSIVFAAIHPQGLAGIPPLAALAFNFALIREWRGSLIGPVFAHALNNGVATVVILLMFR